MAKQKSEQQEPIQKVYRSRREMVTDNFFGGIAWGVGSAVGATVVVALLGYIISTSQRLPFIGDVMNIIVSEVTRSQQ